MNWHEQGIDTNKLVPPVSFFNLKWACMMLAQGYHTWYHDIESDISSRFRAFPVTLTPQMSQYNIRTVVLKPSKNALDPDRSGIVPLDNEGSKVSLL